MRGRHKDRIYESVPMPILQQVLPRFAASRSPFIPEITGRGVIFVHVPKAAGTSVKTEVYGVATGGHRSIGEFAAYDDRLTDEYFKFAFVRNPWDRLLSAYSYLTQKIGTSGRDKSFADQFLATAPTFRDFVLALPDRRFQRDVMHYDHFRTQAHWVCMPGADRPRMDFVGRFESLDDDLAMMRRLLVARDAGQDDSISERPAVLTSARTSEHAQYHDAYDEQTRAIVARVYARDVAMFGYAF